MYGFKETFYWLERWQYIFIRVQTAVNGRKQLGCFYLSRKFLQNTTTQYKRSTKLLCNFLTVHLETLFARGGGFKTPALSRRAKIYLFAYTVPNDNKNYVGVAVMLPQ